MVRKTEIEAKHPLRKLFREALDFGMQVNPCERPGVTDYIEEQILCEFLHAENLYRIRNAAGQSLEDIADILEEGSVLLNAESFQREYQVHKHIGDYTLFMLSMYPAALLQRRGKEFVLGQIVIPGASLSDHYMLQGQRSYRIASAFSHKDLFLELSANFSRYKNILELVRIYLESCECELYLKIRDDIGGTA